MALMDEEEEKDFVDHAETLRDSFNDNEQYEYMLKELPLRKTYYFFWLCWAWSLDEISGKYSEPVPVESLINWAGLDQADLLEQLPTK